MSRILKAYETRFRWLLEQVHARRLAEGVEYLVQKARRVSASEEKPLSAGLTEVYERLALQPRFRPARAQPPPGLFFCDAGLGGLARWLRGAGYEALWEAGIDDDDLLLRARRLGATVLTTDSMLMERRILRDRLIPSFWLPPTLSIADQLELTFREFGLRRRAPRCMKCGGELQAGDKQALQARIPPKTYRWLNEYFVCGRCGKLFWHGTHWLRITKTLQRVAESSSAPAAERQPAGVEKH